MDFRSDHPLKSTTAHQTTRFAPTFDSSKLIQTPVALTSIREQPKSKLFLSELVGTFLLVYLGQATLTSFELVGTQNDTVSRQLSSTLTYGLSYLFAVTLTLGVSGSHLNPAYSVASAFYGHMQWSRVVNYLSAQYLGAFMAAILLHATYSDKLNQRHTEGLLTGSNATLKAHGNILSTGKLFTTFPPNEVSLCQLAISYTLASSVLALLLISIQDSKLIALPRYMRPIYMSAALALTQAAFSANGGPVLNPAQDFSTRLYISLFGWGSPAFNLYHCTYWWFCGILAPHVGALIGFGLYQVLSLEHTRPDKDRHLNGHLLNKGAYRNSLDNTRELTQPQVLELTK